MKKIILLIILFINTNLLFSQEVFYLHAVKIAESEVERFEMIQMDYVTGLAQDAKNNGEIKGWALLKPIDNVGEMTEQEYNYVWVHVFENIDQMLKGNQWWMKSKEKYGIDPSGLYSMGDLMKSGYYYWKTEKQIETTDPGKYIIMNWATPKDLNKAISLADEISEGFKKSMKKEGMTEWGVASKVLPQGEDQSTIFFWDIYDSMKGAFKHMMNQGVLETINPDDFQEFFENMPDGWDGRGIFEIMTGTSN